MAAKAKRVADGVVHFHVYALALHVIQIAALARGLQTYGGMYVSLLDGFYAGDELHAASSADQMADHGLGGADLHVVGVVAQGQLDGLGLEQVVVVGAGSVCIDLVDVSRGDSRILDGVQHGSGSATAVLRRGGDVVGVAGCAVAHNLGQNLRASGFGVL